MVETKSSGSLDDEIERMLLQHRRLFFSTQVDEDSARDTIRKLWFLELTAPGKPITLVHGARA